MKKISSIIKVEIILFFFAVILLNSCKTKEKCPAYDRNLKKINLITTNQNN